MLILPDSPGHEVVGAQGLRSTQRHSGERPAEGSVGADDQAGEAEGRPYQSGISLDKRISKEKMMENAD